ncbi:MAG TPA: hypothetical protein PL044_08410 [Clostridiales bacterium]|nr:MAG: hypothetical protein BWY37_01697 [Firmicutes bacterium ADurb.Bin262]HOU09124.1 hypothetical protein [Clostridiales bacterium]HQH62066.1 hypothetical protein [Clostridiales bacterium]HQK73774.1 hypothetical protein [Clostridiales bacterium]
MTKETAMLRELAREYFTFAREERNAGRLRLHRAVNDLKMVRPVVLIDELPWSEMNINGELTVRCKDPFLAGIEWFLRSNLYKYRHFPADMVLRPYVPVSKVVRSTGNGVSVKEEILRTDKKNSIVSHRYTDQFENDADLAKLRVPVITYDREETRRRYELAGEILGDIIPVKMTGRDYFHVSTWDEISHYRGVTNLLIDLAERPAFSHALARKLTDISLAELEQYERLDLFENDPYSLHCTPVKASDLPGPDYAGGPLTRKNIWGRGAAQIFSSVSKAMHEEFDIAYMIETVGQCGLVYYGCCEALDKKIDIVEKIPHLRKIGATPWADIDAIAETVGPKYVVSAKPNPAAVGEPVLDRDSLRKELRRILGAVKRYGCSCDIVLKDISTCRGRPENIFEWERTAMEEVLAF